MQIETKYIKLLRHNLNTERFCILGKCLDIKKWLFNFKYLIQVFSSNSAKHPANIKHRNVALDLIQYLLSSIEQTIAQCPG